MNVVKEIKKHNRTSEESMGILDQLMEKKDLRIYIDVRIAWLQQERDGILDDIPEKNRNAVRERLNGRIKELGLLRSVIEEGLLKEADKNYWGKLFKDNRWVTMRE